MNTSRGIIVFNILALLFTSACGMHGEAAPKDKLKIGYLPITHAAPLYFEEERGGKYVDGTEIELVKFGSWIELMDALNTGRIDGASVLVELAMKAKEKGIDLKAAALGHKDGNAAVVSPEINGVEDLKGTSVAIPHTLSSHNILMKKMLEKGDMDYGDVNMVEMPPPEMPSALATGQISSYVVAEPFGALGVTMDHGEVLYQSEELWPNSLCCALVLREDLIDRHPTLAEEFVEGYAEAGAAAGHDHDDSRRVHKKYLNVTDEALQLSLGWISYDELKIRKEDYEVLSEELVEMDLSENPPSYEEFVDTTLLEEAGS